MTSLASKLTVILPVYNEAHRVELAIRNFHGKAPIVVIDNLSTDDTAALARKQADRVVCRKNSGLGAKEDYEFMFNQAETEWVLILFAGHYFPPKLIAAIEEAILSEKYDAIALSGLAVQYGQKTNIYGWTRRRKIVTTRLFKKSAIDLSQNRIHHELPYAGDPGKVYYPPLGMEYLIWNYRDDDLPMMNRKTLAYTVEEARQLYERSTPVSGIKVVTSFFYHLAKRLIWRLGILEGVPGIIIAISESYRYFCTDARLWELTREKDQASMMRNNGESRDRLLRQDGR